MPRLLALGSAVLPVFWIPLAYGIEAIVLAGLCCWAFSLEAFRPLLRSDALRATLCILAAVSFPSQELVGDITNLQWHLTMLAVPIALLPPRRRASSARALLLLLGLVIALSSPQALVLAAVIVFIAIRRHTLAEFQAGLALGTLIEWTVIAAHWMPQQRQMHGFAAVDRFVFAVFVAFTNQIAMFCVFGRLVVKSIYDTAYKGSSLVAFLTIMSFLIVISLRGRREYLKKVWAMLWIIFGVLALAMLRGMDAVYTDMSSVQPWGAHRYFLAGCWCFAFIVLLTIEEYKPAWPAYRQCALAAAIFAVGTYGNFRLAPHSAGDWKKSAAEIENWKTAREAGRPHAEVVVPVSPKGWAIYLPKLAGSPEKGHDAFGLIRVRPVGRS